MKIQTHNTVEMVEEDGGVNSAREASDSVERRLL